MGPGVSGQEQDDEEGHHDMCIETHGGMRIDKEEGGESEAKGKKDRRRGGPVPAGERSASVGRRGSVRSRPVDAASSVVRTGELGSSCPDAPGPNQTTRGLRPEHRRGQQLHLGQLRSTSRPAERRRLSVGRQAGKNRPLRSYAPPSCDQKRPVAQGHVPLLVAQRQPTRAWTAV